MAELRLLILRHAKAEPAIAGQSDFDRPLAERGHEQMTIIGPMIVEAGFAPSRILCSSALRTRETLEDLVPVLPALAPVTLSRAVYEADSESLLSQIAATAGGVGSLLVIGHNPTLHELALAMAGSGERDVRRQLSAGFPTAAFAAIAFDVEDWAAVQPGEGRLLAVLTPKGID